MYTKEALTKLIDGTVKNIWTLAALKGGEYAGDGDRLENFKRNAQNLGLLPETVWAVYASKHWDAVMQYVKDLQTQSTRERLETISGRADDLIVYLILFKALVEDRTRNEGTKKEEPTFYPCGVTA